ncbi:MAG: Rid family detoxifying hydrolase [bacterium]
MNRSVVIALVAGTLLGAVGWAALTSARQGLEDPLRGPRGSLTAPSKEAVLPEGAPAPVGPYSPAVRYGDLLFLSGQIGMDPATGRLVEGGVIPETRQALANLGILLEAAGLDLEDAVRVTVYLTDLDDYEDFNTEYARWMGEVPPARAAVEAARLPGDARVEISLIAGGAGR